MSYVQTVRRPPTTLTEIEQARLLAVTGEHARGFRDHVLFALALGTGLREMEVAALNVGDVTIRQTPGAAPSVKRRIVLRVFKRSAKDPAPQTVFLPDSIVYKLRKFLRWKIARDEKVGVDDPLFISRKGNRLSCRMIRLAFANWQDRAGFDRRFTFHQLRHTALTNVYRRTKDIRLVQRVARHKNINTTTIYASPSDEDILRAIRDLPC
jgi:site-specific recombinase XerD